MSNLSKRKNKKAISEKENNDEHVLDSDIRPKKKDLSYSNNKDMHSELKMSNNILFFSPKVFVFVLLCGVLLIFSDTCDIFQKYSYLFPVRYSTPK